MVNSSLMDERTLFDKIAVSRRILVYKASLGQNLRVYFLEYLTVQHRNSNCAGTTHALANKARGE